MDRHGLLVGPEGARTVPLLLQPPEKNPSLDIPRFVPEQRLDQDERLKPGLTTTVEILVSENPDVVYVPVSAVFLDEHDQSVVYVKEGGRAVKRPVVLGGSTDRVAIVESGVQEGEELLLALPTAL